MRLLLVLLLLLLPSVAVARGSSAPAGYDDVGNGFCVDAQQQRPGVWLCFSTAKPPDCPAATAASCGKLCSADVFCKGFMIQDMSMYQLPPACSLVTTKRPVAPGTWQWGPGPGSGQIAGHDQEKRDECYRKQHGPTPPGPPPPPPAPPPPPPPPPPGACPDGTNCGSYTCCKLREPFGYGCAGAGGAVCCPDRVHYCLGGYVCNMTALPPPAGHAGAWGETGAWHCSKKPGAAGADERRRAARLAALPPPPPPPPPPLREREQTNGDNCFGEQQPWQTWPSQPPLKRCAAGDHGDQQCTPYEPSTDIQGVQFNHCQGWTSGNYPFGQSSWDSDFPKLDLNGGGSSDTWYPYWASDGRWYSTYTDGTVGGCHAQSGGAAPSMHGQVVVEPDGGKGFGQIGNVNNMSVVQAATFAVNATPFAGNYPTGVFTSNASGTEIWYYGTYPVMGGNISKWLVGLHSP